MTDTDEFSFLWGNKGRHVVKVIAFSAYMFSLTTYQNIQHYWILQFESLDKVAYAVHLLCLPVSKPL